MGREIRMVPPGWEHPKNTNGTYVPLLNGPYENAASEWDSESDKWSQGLESDFNGGWAQIPEKYRNMTFSEWSGNRPRPEDYMPVFAYGTATHLMMYETCSEGTPISPAFSTPEELARWLADNNASAFGSMTATYEQWLAAAKRGLSPSAVVGNDGIVPGVAM